MKVLVVDPSLYTPPYDGALCGALLARGHDVTLVGRPPRPTDPPLGAAVPVVPLFYADSEARRAAEGDGRWLKVRKAFEHVGDVRRLVEYVRATRPDVVHWQWPSLPWIDAGAVEALQPAVAQVATVHDANVFHQHGLARLRAVGWTRFLRAADRLIAHLATTRQALQALGIDGGRVAIVPHGIFPAEAAGPRATGGDGRLHAVAFGRLTRDKGIDVLAGALARLQPATRERILFHVAGPVPVGDRASQAVVDSLRGLQHVRVRNEFVPEAELNALLRAADVGVFAHREVDASGALMKALAYDLAVVASDIPAFVELFGGTRAARHFRAGDPDALAAALDALAADPGEIARLKAATGSLRAAELSWPSVAERTERVYDDARRSRRQAA